LVGLEAFDERNALLFELSAHWGIDTGITPRDAMAGSSGDQR
jgi:hypothetical protein